MITNVINWSIANRMLVLLLTAILLIFGAYSLRTTPVDAKKPASSEADRAAERRSPSGGP